MELKSKKDFFPLCRFCSLCAVKIIAVPLSIEQPLHFHLTLFHQFWNYIFGYINRHFHLCQQGLQRNPFPICMTVQQMLNRRHSDFFILLFRNNTKATPIIVSISFILRWNNTYRNIIAQNYFFGKHFDWLLHSLFCSYICRTLTISKKIQIKRFIV